MQQSGIWTRIEQQKQIFVEPKTKVEFCTAMDNFYERVNSDCGAVFAAVCRGKVTSLTVVEILSPKNYPLYIASELDWTINLLCIYPLVVITEKVCDIFGKHKPFGQGFEQSIVEHNVWCSILLGVVSHSY